jgi:hypothetical protein
MRHQGEGGRMTKSQADIILDRLDRIQQDIDALKNEMAETRGAFRLAKFVLAILGLSGIGGLLTWISGQGE